MLHIKLWYKNLKITIHLHQNMIHSSTISVVHLFTRCCQLSHTSVGLETSILLPPPSVFFQNISTPISSQDVYHHAGPRS